MFYTVHAERGEGNPKTPNFIPPGFTLKDVTYHNVITEWHATNPAANAFEGTRREVFRGSQVVANLTHPLGAIDFNPTAKPGDPDYGLLYTSGSDHGFSNGGGPNANTASQTQRLDSIMTAILRFDPRSPKVSGGMKGLGDYTISMANKFASDGDPKTLGEIYAYGFRNAHRLSWDTDGTMFASDIGMNQIEEINIVRNGENYGWMKREGYWETGRWRGGELIQLFPLAADLLNGREKDGLTYPVAMYDHDEGRSVTDGFAYHGRIAALQGKFVFGDIQNGRVFAADLAEMKKADDGIPQTVAPIEEIQLYVLDQWQTDECVDAGTRRSDDGREHPPRRSAHKPDSRWRASSHIQAGWDHTNARSINPSPSGRGLGEGRSRVVTSTLTRRSISLALMQRRPLPVGEAGSDTPVFPSN